MSKTIDVKIGDSRDVLKTIPDNSIHCCVTSPPYYGLRDYGVNGQIGLEQSPEEYVNELVNVFREVRRILRKDGTLWLNLGDSYVGGAKKGNTEGVKQKTNKGATWGDNDNLATLKSHIEGLKNKDLIGIPWRVAFALQADGWYLRQDIVWEKGNCMPESVTDRCTKSHEFIFLLTKSNKYFFDNEAIKEQSVSTHPSGNGFKRSARVSYQNPDGSARGNDEQWKVQPSRNKRDVWKVNTKPYKGAHFATFSPELIEPCILAGTSENGVCSECGSPYIRMVEKTRLTRPELPKDDPRYRPNIYHGAYEDINGKSDAGYTNTKTIGWEPSCSCNSNIYPAVVLDPFGGSGTVGEVCNRLNRNAILIELNPEYKHLIEKRINEKPKSNNKKRKVSHTDKLILQQNLIQYFS